MKILIINTSDTGGAAKASIRLHRGLLKKGIDSHLLLLIKKNIYEDIPNSSIFLQPINFYTFFKRLKNRFIRILKKCNLYFGLDDPKYLKNRTNKLDFFSTPFSPFLINDHKLFKDADIIHLTWVAGFLDYNNFFRNNNKKIIWTLHDSAPFTGGCHVPFDCIGFKDYCKKCPILIGTIDYNYSHYLLELKNKSLKNVSNLTIVGPSKWLTVQSNSSKIFSRFKHHIIPHGIDSKVFKPYDKASSRKSLKLPLNKKIILFISDYLFRNGKGFLYLLKALEKIGDNNILIYAVGSTQKNIYWENLITLGEINEEEKMAMLYSSADVLAIPSFSESFSNTAVESILCGTPVIGFPVGGLLDIIKDNFNGILCKSISVDSLQFSIEKFFNNLSSFNRENIRKDAVERYDIEICVNNYVNLYKEILKNP